MLYVIRLDFRNYLKPNDLISGVSYDLLLGQPPARKDGIFVDYIADAETPEQANRMAKALVLLCDSVHSVCGWAFDPFKLQPGEKEQRRFARFVKLMLQAFGYRKDCMESAKAVRELADTVFQRKEISDMILKHTQPGRPAISHPRHVLDPAIVKAAEEEARSILTSDYPRSPQNIKDAISRKIKELCQEPQGKE